MITQHHETLVVIEQRHKEIAQDFRAANGLRKKRIHNVQIRQFNLRVPRWWIRLILEPITSVSRYNSVSQTL